MDNEMKIALGKPYTFEQKEYKAIDLTGLDGLTTADLIWAQRQLSAQGVATTLPEFDYAYCCLLAARAAKLPYELFMGLSAHDAAKIRSAVSGFLFSGD